MILLLSSSEPPRLVEFDRLDRLHAELEGPPEAARLDDLCTSGDEGHVWLDIAAAKAAGMRERSDDSFGEQFDAMIGYAASKGWLDADGSHVRVHVEGAG